MTEPDTTLRTCPSCDARYKVVRIDSDATDTLREIACRSCGAPLQARDGKSILKYFLVSGRGGRRHSA